MPMQDILRVFLATYFGVAAVLYTAKILAFEARTGVQAQHFGKPGSAQFLGRLMFEAFRWAIFAACVQRVVWPEADGWAGPIGALMIEGLEVLGAGLMLAGLGVVIYGHSYLGDDWRTGVPRDGPTVLHTKGPYAVVRHPIFAGVHLAQLGFFLAWPTVFTLVCLVVGATVIQIQARVEDKRLQQSFGAAFSRYAKRTPAFAPRVFRRIADAPAIAD